MKAIDGLATSAATLCRDNCQLIGEPINRIRSAGKKNGNYKNCVFSSAATLCRDNCQLIGKLINRTRSAR